MGKRNNTIIISGILVAFLLGTIFSSPNYADALPPWANDNLVSIGILDGKIIALEERVDALEAAGPIDDDADGFSPPDDCNDADDTIFPGAAEIADDGIDQDCNGTDTITCFLDGDGDGFGTDSAVTVLAPDGSCDIEQSESTISGDCDDGNPAVSPGEGAWARLPLEVSIECVCTHEFEVGRVGVRHFRVRQQWYRQQWLGSGL